MRVHAVSRRVHKARRWMYVTHRWLGIGMCLLLAMWFFSGVVMMYVGFPELTRTERLAGLPPLDPHEVRVGPHALLSRQDPAGVVETLQLVSIAGRPAWYLGAEGDVRQVMFADTGEPVGPIGPAQARQAATMYVAAAGLGRRVVSEDGTNTDVRADIDYQGVVDMDQWTVSSSLHSHRPLHRLVVNDRAGTALYISSRTGEVVRDTTALERGWNWLGANLHWLPATAASSRHRLALACRGALHHRTDSHCYRRPCWAVATAATQTSLPRFGEQPLPGSHEIPPSAGVGVAGTIDHLYVQWPVVDESVGDSSRRTAFQ